MADSDLQAALHQSKVFDLNQVAPNRRVLCPFALILRFLYTETNDFDAIFGRFQAGYPGTHTCSALLLF